MVNATPRKLCPPEWDPVSVLQDALLAPETVWKGGENLVPNRIRVAVPTMPSRPTKSTTLNLNLDSYDVDVESEPVFPLDLSYSVTVKSLVKWTREWNTWTVTWSE